MSYALLLGVFQNLGLLLLLFLFLNMLRPLEGRSPTDLDGHVLKEGECLLPRPPASSLVKLL